MGRCVVPMMLLAVAGLVAGSCFPTLRADDEETLERYLDRLGLEDLRLQHLESMLDRQSEEGRRQQLARQLADLYAERMINAADDKAVFEDISGRIARLLERFPAARTVALEVARLQGDYRRAESLFLRWMDDRSADDLKRESLSILERITGLLARHQSDLYAELKTLQDRLDKLDPQKPSPALEAELSRVSMIAARATYFLGWSNYYRGVLEGNSGGKTQAFHDSRIAFRKLLDLENEVAYRDIKAEFLGLESLWRSRALIGLALDESALGHPEDADLLFQLLESPISLPAIRDLIPYWRLAASIHGQRLAIEATQFVQLADAMAGEPSPGKVAFLNALVRAALSSRAVNDGASMSRLAEAGIRGLLRLRQDAVLRQIMERYDLPLREDAGFAISFALGQRRFERAEKSGKSEDYRLALQALQQARSSGQATVGPSELAACHQLLGWCHYRMGDAVNGAGQFHQAAILLRESDRAAGADSAWMAFVCWQTKHKKDGSALSQTIEALEWLRREFPDSGPAKKAEFQLTRLQAGSRSAEDRARKLQAITADNPDYLASRFELCAALVTKWRDTPDRNQAAELGAGVLKVARQYFDASTANDRRVTSDIRVALFALEVLAAKPGMDEQELAYFESRASSLASKLPMDARELVEFHYRQFQFARYRSDAVTASREATWLSQHGRGSTFELPALVVVAQDADEAYKKAAPDERREYARKAADAYQRLLELSGDTPEMIRSKTNARVAVSRLAQLRQESGDYPAAIGSLEKLLRAYPNDKSYLRRIAIAEFQAEHWAASLERWRRLVAGLEKGQAEWMEAKYYQIECLVRSDPEAAQVVFDQFKLLYPSLGEPPWRQRFEEVGRKLVAVRRK